MIRFGLVAFLVLTNTVVSTPPGVLAQRTEVAVAIHRGACDAAGDIAAPLTDATVPTGTYRGSVDALPAATSVTSVPISLAALTSADHAIVVPFPAGEEIVACGNISGALTATGDLTIGIRPMGDIDISGIAYLSPSPDAAQTTISLFLSGEDLNSFLDTTFRPLAIAPEDATRFADALASRNAAEPLAGPFADTLGPQDGRGAGVATDAFSVTVTFVNPTTQTETPWDVGLVFHQNAEQTAAQAVAVSSDGFWFHQNDSAGTLRAAPQAAFDATPGATNTLDLVVEGTTAFFGINGEFVGALDLPASTVSDVFVTAGYFSDHDVTGREITYNGFTVWGGQTVPLAAAMPTGDAGTDATLLADAINARDGVQSIAGPFGGKIVQAPDMLGGRPAGITTANFSATVSFVNPEDSSGIPWDYGLAFHQSADGSTIQEVYVDADGFWAYTNFPSGIQQSGVVPSFDASPGGMNTLDLIVVDQRALFGVNGEFVAQFDLPPVTASDVLAATDFQADNVLPGREIIYSGFEVWEATDPSSLSGTASDAMDDADRFAAALAAREASWHAEGPFTHTLVQAPDAPAVFGFPSSEGAFSTTATFVNPTVQTDVPWDVGFAFGRTPDRPAYRVYVDSERFWYVGPTRAGYVPQFDPTAGATNTLDLTVDGDTALFGINGTFVARIALQPPGGTGLWVVAGSDPAHGVVGRDIDVRDFEVWRQS